MISLSFAVALLSGSFVSAQVTGTFPATPLASKTGFVYPSNIPEKVDNDTGLLRGTQFGYNRCNSTTEGPSSLCQTSFLNGLDDFCLWGPSAPNSTVSDQEGEMVAWCTKPGRGTRIIPAGALQGVQYIKTPDYVQVVGFIDQQQINIAHDDFGGEMDPHGADLRGNPMGGIVFSTAFNGKYEQVVEWHNFMGGNAFCFKVCDPKGPNAANYCQHIYDRIGCAYNAPNNAQSGVFETCEGENQDFPGVYTTNGAVVTYTQPPESLGAISTMPYTARIPASSNCVTHASSELFAALPTPTITPSSSSSAATNNAPLPTQSANSKTGGSPVVATTSAGASKTAGTTAGTTAATPRASNNGASSVVASAGATFFGAVLAVLFL